MQIVFKNHSALKKSFSGLNDLGADARTDSVADTRADPAADSAADGGPNTGTLTGANDGAFTSTLTGADVNGHKLAAAEKELQTSKSSSEHTSRRAR